RGASEAVAVNSHSDWLDSGESRAPALRPSLTVGGARWHIALTYMAITTAAPVLPWRPAMYLQYNTRKCTFLSKQMGEGRGPWPPRARGGPAGCPARSAGSRPSPPPPRLLPAAFSRRPAWRTSPPRPASPG